MKKIFLFLVVVLFTSLLNGMFVINSYRFSTSGDGYTVAGAGTTAVNGHYSYVGLDSTSKPYYKHDSSNIWLQFDTNPGLDSWMITSSLNSSEGAYYHQSSGDTLSTTPGDWDVLYGASPVFTSLTAD